VGRGRPVVAAGFGEVVYFVTWGKQGSPTRRIVFHLQWRVTPVAGSFQAAPLQVKNNSISAAETAFLAAQPKANAEAAQHRPGCRASS